MDKIIVQKCQKNFYKALYKVLIEIFFDMIKKPRNRKPRNGKPRKTRDYCIDPSRQNFENCLLP